MKGSLRSKIIAWSVVPTAIILITVALVNLVAYQRVTETLVIERDRDLAQLSATLLAAEILSYTDPLSDQYLAAFDGVVVLKPDGTVLSPEPQYDEAGLPAWSQTAPLAKMLNASGPVYSDVVEDRRQGDKFIIAVMPFQDRDGQPAGGIAGLFRLDPATDSALSRSVERLRQGENKSVCLVDGNGLVIYHSSPAYTGEDFSGQEAVQRVSKGETGALRVREPGARDIVASYAPVPGTSWGLVMEEDWAMLARSGEGYRRFLLALLALGVVLPTTVIAVGARQITKPIAALIEAAREIAKGRFDQRITATAGDELEELATQFNLMTVQLQESYASLQQQVADRTKELATLNAIAAEASGSLDLGEIMHGALGEVLDAMSIEKGQAFRLEEETQTLVLMAHRGLSEELVRFTARQPLEGATAGLAAREGKPVIRQVAEYKPGRLKDLVSAEGIRIVISTPLLFKGKTVGAMDLGATRPWVATPESLSLLTAIGHQVGIAVENARLYEQSQQLAVVQERNRLARDLHDSVTQALYGVTLCAEAAARHLSSENPDTNMAARHLCEIKETTQSALREMRLLIFELRPPIVNRKGLAIALQARLDAVERRFGLDAQFIGDAKGSLAPEIEEGLYRIAQEALNNVLKHACASKVTVRLVRNGDSVCLEIADDGVGFSPEVARKHGGFGLRSMEERAAQVGATLHIESGPGQGTRIKMEVRR